MSMRHPFPEPTQAQREAVIFWRNLCRDIKRQGRTWDYASEEVQQSALALHQNALMVEGYDRQQRKAKEYEARLSNQV